MDILDLSLGEKRSRRKTNAPQRRHGLDHSPSGIDEEQNDLPSDDVTTALNKAPLEGAGETKMVALDELKKINLKGLYEEKETSKGLEHVDSARSFASSPHESEDKQSVEKDSNDNITPSPRSLNENILDQPAHSYHGNYNSNNNNTNNTINIPLTRFPQIPSTTAGSYSNSDPISNLAAFQERFSAFSASMPQSVLRGAMKAPMATPYASYDVQPIDAPGIPERTKKQNRWAFNVWREWARKRNLSENSVNGSVVRVPLDVGKATEEELDYWLSKFVKEIRRKDGNPYPPHTLMQIVMGIQRYLRQQAGRPSICILDRSNPVYGRFRSVLDSRIKELTTEGVTASHKGGRRSSLPASTNTNTNNNNYASLNYPEQSVLWEAGIIGNDTALGLLNAVFYHNTVTFGIRNVDDHWNLKMSHFVLGNRGQQSQSYIEFVPSRDPIYVNRGLTKDKKVQAEPGNPRCVVKLFQKYLSLVPADGPFYRHPQEPTLVDRSIRFSDQWVGKNRLRAMIKHVFDSTRLDGRERGQSGGSSSSSMAPRFPANQFMANNDARASTPTVYDRLAQVMMQLTYMRPNSQIPTPASSKSPTIPAPVSPKAESCDYDSSPSFSQSGPPAAPGRNEIVLKRESSPDSLLEASHPKRRKTSFDDESAAHANAAEETDDVKVTSSSEKHIEENMLEIAVPRNIDTVVVVKGTKRITIQLD